MPRHDDSIDDYMKKKLALLERLVVAIERLGFATELQVSVLSKIADKIEPPAPH